jgi:hypothetical protein
MAVREDVFTVTVDGMAASYRGLSVVFPEGS